MARFVAAALVLSAVVSVGCSEQARFRPSQIGGAGLDIDRAGAVIRHGNVGAGRFQGEGTYVLVDATNRLATDVDVSLEGELLDSQGRAIGALNPDSLRIPAGAQRTFALVHHAGKLADAASADIRVGLVQVAHYALPVHTIDGNVYQDGERVVVAANVVNDTEREIIAVVIAGFYDDSGRIMQRPFSAIRLPPKLTKPARFVGPDGSTRGYLFVGQLMF